MITFLTVIHIVTCIVLVLIILVQSGKGAEISASFGGSSQTVFGTSGGANFLTKVTTGAAAVFMLTSVLLTMLNTAPTGLMEKEPLPPPASSSTQESAPAQAGAQADKAAAQPATETTKASDQKKAPTEKK